ncbi:MAG: tetratricopeptide repeat protein, partial [Bacteroidetes bacterium]|nr:tetratricopeptide repeat protein [Bacteroidota bacterium]
LPRKETVPNPEELLACGDASIKRGSNQEVWRSIISLCGEGDYGQMIRRLEEWLTAQPDDAEAKIYLGRALALEGRYEEAEAVFISIETDARILPQTRLDAQWYMALSMIKAGDVERACEILEAIQALLGSKRQKIAANFTQNICGK